MTGKTVSISKLQIKNLPPSLVNWIVRYDDDYEMPMHVQGNYIGEDTEDHAAGAVITMKNILSLDMLNRQVTSTDGERFGLIGPGKRMLLLNEEEIMSQMVEMLKDPNEYID